MEDKVMSLLPGSEALISASLCSIPAHISRPSLRLRPAWGNHQETHALAL